MHREKPHPISGLPTVFKALSDPTRLRLLNLLLEEEVCVCLLCDVLRMVQPKVSRHLAYLKKAELVEARREGQWMHYSWTRHTNPIVRSTMDGLRDWFEKDRALTAERKRLTAICCE